MEMKDKGQEIKSKESNDKPLAFGLILFIVLRYFCPNP
ncbi:hypothetical protein S3E15_03855 [Bacillus mycoides]|uniref:Uncharacterized protein n=1 Tax=Bacillus mycoides TaxID=1405 RepID=A0AAP7W445_BACMY|nr:hypothetical protein SZ39_0988 [Bacillus mycoides]OSX89532.1 hypothetical protein S3E15_03855 [Bacillus mycoides]OSX97786.1 hypothetical protein BTJ44_00425 [Bacillus mycoides]OSY06107.1 hypothetical protein BTJ48_03899 [Bacillus mycoides]